MKFKVLCVGKLKEPYLRSGVEEFVKRLKPYGGVTIQEINESKIGDKPSEAQKEQALMDEGQRLLKLCGQDTYIVLLDVYGDLLSSEQLAKEVQKLEVSGISEMAFLIGGAFGVSEELRRVAKKRLSFSPMTFTHQMVRLLLVEQLYRACKINKNEPYHW